MFPPMPKQPKGPQLGVIRDEAVANPPGFESLGGGPMPMQPMPFTGTDAQPMAQPMGKPDGGQLGVIRPMPELGPQNPGQPVAPSQPRPAKPQGAGPMPDPNMAPRIRAPQNPGYNAQAPMVPQVSAPQQ